MHNMPNGLELFASSAQRRQLITPLLLLLASHRPLTFITGQLLYALAPICALLGWNEINPWAALLSAPDANQRLAAILSTPTLQHLPRKTAGEQHVLE